MLLKHIKEHLTEAKALQEKLNEDYYIPDYFYRFYHQSYKVTYSFSAIDKCLALFTKIAGEKYTLNADYLALVERAKKNSKFDHSWNKDWIGHTAPIVEALLHSKMFLDLLIKHGSELEEEPQILDSGWAAVLYLFNCR